MDGLERVCEPELMDDEQQALQYAQADFSASDAATLERLLQRFDSSALGPRIIDLGCGPGNLTFPLADRCPQATLLGLDGAGAMLRIAAERRQLLARHGNGNGNGTGAARIAFQQAVLPLAPAAAATLGGPFTALVSNSLLHHLHDPLVFWRSLLQLGAAGAAVYCSDLRRPRSEADLSDLVARHAAGLPPLVQRDFAHSLRAAFRPEELVEQLQRLGLTTLQVESRDDRYLEVHGRLPE